MSVVNQFDATVLRFGLDPRQVYILGIDGQRLIFKYDIFCKAGKIGFFFNVKEGTSLVYINTGVGPLSSNTSFKCATMRFWVENDIPVMSANWIMDQGTIIHKIFDDFKQQYASYLLDNVINA